MTNSNQVMGDGELLPCPFCGTPPYIRRWANGSRIECPSRDCFGPFTSMYGDEADAIAVWNQRTSVVTPSPALAPEAEPKRWLVEEAIPGGSTRWQIFEHEHQCRTWAASASGPCVITPLYPAPPASPVQVKVAELSWGYNSALKQWHGNPIADTGPGYLVSGTRWCINRSYERRWILDATSVEVAKAQCQADYEARIRSTLVSQSAVPEGEIIERCAKSIEDLAAEWKRRGGLPRSDGEWPTEMARVVRALAASPLGEKDNG